MDSFVSKISIPVETPVQDTKAEGKVETSENKPIDVIPPLMKYSEVKGHPYSVDYFNIDYWGALTKETDVDDIKGKVKQIEQYAQAEIKSRNLENTVSSYNEVLMAIVSRLNLSDNEEIGTKLSKVAKYIKLLSKQQLLEKENKGIREQIFGLMGDS